VGGGFMITCRYRLGIFIHGEGCVVVVVVVVCARYVIWVLLFF